MAKRSKRVTEHARPSRTRKRAKLEVSDYDEDDDVEEDQASDIESSDYDREPPKIQTRKQRGTVAKRVSRSKKTKSDVREGKVGAPPIAQPKKKRGIKGPIKFLDFPLDIVEEVTCTILSCSNQMLTECCACRSCAMLIRTHSYAWLARIRCCVSTSCIRTRSLSGRRLGRTSMGYLPIPTTWLLQR